MKKYTKKGIIASIAIIAFLASSFLVFAIQPLIVFIINAVELLLFGLIFSHTKIPKAIFILGILIYLAFSATVIIFPLSACREISEYANTQNNVNKALEGTIFNYRFNMIIVAAVTLLFIGFVFYVNFFDSDVDYDAYPEDVSLTGVLGAMGGIMIMLSWISGALAKNDSPALIAPTFFAAIHSVLTWFIKCLRRGWVHASFSSGNHTYDVNKTSARVEHYNHNSSTYKLRDEKGEIHTLSYDGGMEAVDETGTVWITQNGGHTFRKRGLYIYTDPDGHKEYLTAPYATTGESWPSKLVDKKGNSYSVARYGELEEDRLANWDDGSPREIIDVVRLSQSEERPAERVNDGE